MDMLWSVLLVALAIFHFGHALPVGSTSQSYPHDPNAPAVLEGWASEGGLYAAVPALALVLAAVGLIFGCAWCYRHKDCKPNEGAEAQLFTASASQLHEARRSQPPDSGFSEPVNNNISEDNNNGPISLREMQNIANNNAAAYIVSENEERNRVSRESVVEFEPLPSGIRVLDPLEHCADWFGGEDLSRNKLQYLREIGRGWFGRIVEGEMEEEGTTTTVAVKILNQNASLEDKARFLDEARLYRDLRHENILPLVSRSLQEDPWILIFEFCSMDLQQYLVVNRPKMAILNESGVPLQLMCDVTSALAYLHSRGYMYGVVWSGAVLVRGAEAPRAVLGPYPGAGPPHGLVAPETRAHNVHTASSEVWSLGTLIWEICAWGAVPQQHPPSLPDLPCPYRNHLYQVMQLCWNENPEARPTSTQIRNLINHLHSTHTEASHDDGYGSSDFEERWQRLKPNSIPIIDEHTAMVHAPSTSMASHFTGSEEFDKQTVQDTLSLDMDTAVSRSSSIMSDNPLSVQIKSESLTNLHGSLEDVRNIYLTHNETAVLECHQGNIGLDDGKEKDRSDSSMDPWVKEIIAGSQDDVSYYKDVSDVIKNLDNILNSEKTSSSESSHQASPSRDNLSLDCKSNFPQSSMVKSPGINNFQNILEMGFDKSPENEFCEDDDMDRDTIGTLSHSFERHSDTISQHTLENITPITPVKDIDIINEVQNKVAVYNEKTDVVVQESIDVGLPKENNVENCASELPKLKDLCVASMVSVSETDTEQLNVIPNCQAICDNNLTGTIRTDISKVETKSIDDSGKFDRPDEEKVVIDNASEPVRVQKTELSEFVKVTPEDNSTDSNSKNDVLDDNIREGKVSNYGESPDSSVILASAINSLGNYSDVILDKNPTMNYMIERKSVTPLERSDGFIKVDLLNHLENDTIQDKVAINENNIRNIEKACTDDILPDNIDNSASFNEVNNHEVIHNSNGLDLLSITSDENKMTDIQKDINKHFIENECRITTERQIPLQAVNTVIKISSHEGMVNNKHDLIEEVISKPTALMKSNAELPDVEEPMKGNIDHTQINKNSLEITTIPDLNNCQSSKSETLFHDNVKNEIKPLDYQDFNETLISNIVLENVKVDLSETSHENDELFFRNNTDEIKIQTVIKDKVKDTDKDRAESDLLKELAENTPEIVQNTDMIEKVDKGTDELIEAESGCAKFVDDVLQSSPVISLPELVQTDSQQSIKPEENVESIDKLDFKRESEDIDKEVNCNDSTVYMDLINDTNSEIQNNAFDNTHDLYSCIQMSDSPNVKNESTVYLDLPSVIKLTDNFLQSERECCNNDVICSSTPFATADNTLENVEDSMNYNGNDLLSETKVPDEGVTLIKLEQKCVPDSIQSPFESPTKSHHTDTYDENSSVVLGPFENCNLELFRGVKSSELVELPKEELLAFSSNFSEMNLATPSPLRDGNFLNEVPDIVHDDLHFDDIASNEGNKLTDSVDTEDSVTEKRVSPSTPPNSPGCFLASTSQEKYLVDIHLNGGNDVIAEDAHDIDLNQIELQITTKLAMAENENNMNIEYSGPLIVQGLGQQVEIEEGNASESYLAGNGGSIELREELSLNEECMKALRNELELKLPLTQVAAIEPQAEGEWSSELPPPPELVVSYPGALSPIAEETRQQLSAYENDLNWNPSTRTDSSESYPEPCNNSTDEVTDLLTGAQSGLQAGTYTVHSNDNSLMDTYTVQKDINTSKEFTMSADSLNDSPHRNPNVNDITYVKNEDEKESNCERISQVSPFLMSPATDTSAPDNSYVCDNATGVSTLSKTTVATDAKSSKPSETQCLSKATSIDSWCSNDTLYNVEENFDDLAMDPEVPLDFEPDSVSSDTLTHNDDDKELSHCSTYIVHDSKSEVVETFSPDSITANDNYTYTKVKTEAATATKSDVNDSKNTQTKDLAYETLMSGVPSYSNCTTEVMSSKDLFWNPLPQPEMVRKSPTVCEVNLTPPKYAEDKQLANDSPQLNSEPCINKMDSVDITCLQDNLLDQSKSDTTESPKNIKVTGSPDFHYENMTQNATSTPLADLHSNDDNGEVVTFQLPNIFMNDVSNFRSFQQSAEMRPQDVSTGNDYINTSEDTGILLKGETTMPSMRSTKDSLGVNENTPSYRDFENSAVTKPQDVHSGNGSSLSVESGTSSEDFRKFEINVRNRPQDLSTLIDASSLLLQNERISCDVLIGESVKRDVNAASQSESMNDSEAKQSLDISPPNNTNLIESHVMYSLNDPIDNFVEGFELEDETEQPHSIIITESPKVTPDTTNDSHMNKNVTDLMFDSCLIRSLDDCENHDVQIQPLINGINEAHSTSVRSITAEQIPGFGNVTDLISLSQHEVIVPNASLNEIDSETVHEDGIKCNGGSEKFATVNFIHENFEELLESNVDDTDNRDTKTNSIDEQTTSQTKSEDKLSGSIANDLESVAETPECISKDFPCSQKVESNVEEMNVNSKDKVSLVTENFLQNEKNFCQFDSYLPLLSDIRFTGPASEIMSTSFTQESPTEPTSPECEQDSKPDPAADILKEWDSDSDSHSNSSSGEFIWKQRGTNQPEGTGGDGAPEDGAPSEGSGDSGSGSEGDEVEFVPSSWDCSAAPSKSSLRSLEQTTPDNKKRVVFKRQKYHCVYEYPREVADLDSDSPAAYLPDLSTYSEWDPSSVEDADVGYGQLFGAPNPLDLYPLRAAIPFGADYDDDFYISSSARPFESLGIMSTTSQFFPGMHVKAMLERDLPDEPSEEFPPPPSPLPPTLVSTRTPSLDFTTPDSGVEDITPGSTIDDYKKIPETDVQAWRPIDSGSSSESVSPSSPGGEALGGLRHTRDKLKLDLPPSPHLPSPRHSRVFNFVLDKPKRRMSEERAEGTPLVMTDETPVVDPCTLPLEACEDVPVPEPTFSTFGKSVPRSDTEPKGIVLTDEAQPDSKDKEEPAHGKVEPVKGEGTVLDSGDEDSGIESSSKATLERNKTSNVS